MAKTLKNEAGASLVEIILAVVIISVTTLLIMSFSRNALRMGQDARANDAAYLAAEQKLADLSNMVFPTLPQNSSTPEEVTIDNIKITLTWNVAQSGFVTCGTVAASWQPMGGTAKQITLAGAIN